MAEDRMLNDEILLGLIKKNGGSGGTTDYEALENLPEINGVELKGNKSLSDLGIASAQSVENITNGESINNFAGVETALGNKQGKLTAGDYIEISNNEVSVNRYAIPAGDIVYRAVTVNATTAYVDKYTLGGTFIERINITANIYQTQDVENKIRFYREFDGWVITLLANSKEHNAGYSYSARSSSVASENDFTFTLPQVEDDNDLIIREELDKKADTDMVAADFNAGSSYTAGNYCVQDGKLYKFKNNHSGAWAAADVDEVKITGELSALKSGLNNQTVPQLVTTATLASGLSGKVTCIKIGQLVLVSGYCSGTMAQNDEIVQNLPAYRGGFDIQVCRYPAILDGNIVSPIMFTASNALSVVAACSSVNFFVIYVTN